MLSHILVSVISDDKPGVVEAIAETISNEGGNWLESRLSQLSGKFAGVIRLSIAPEKTQALETKLLELDQKGIWIKCEQVETATKNNTENASAKIHVLGPDRSGIVKELSTALVAQQINLAELETSLSSMPYSGDPLFEASGQLEIPLGTDRSELRDTLDRIADALALDISFSEDEEH
ncbi:MAG: cellulose-binding protein [Agarilytica sp.]